MRSVPLWIATVGVCLMATTACSGRAPTSNKSYTFRGKIEAVDKKARNLTVNGEKIDGWMDAMTMDYKVDDPSILDRLNPGDQITATVYDGDEKLHKVEVVGSSADSKK